MNQIRRRFLRVFRLSSRFLPIAVVLLLAVPVFAQGASPWENAVNALQTAFTSTIARGLSLVAIVVAGLTFAFGEGGSKRILAGVLFGVKPADPATYLCMSAILFAVAIGASWAPAVRATRISPIVALRSE